VILVVDDRHGADPALPHFTSDLADRRVERRDHDVGGHHIGSLHGTLPEI